MSKPNFSMDFSDFDKKSKQLIQKALPEAAAKGLREAGQEWKLDADNVPPRTPHKEGGLRASGKVSKVTVQGQNIGVEVSYNTPYAARWHEIEPGLINWSESGVGPKYLESKAVRFANKYVNIVVSNIRSVR